MLGAVGVAEADFLTGGEVAMSEGFIVRICSL